MERLPVITIIHTSNAPEQTSKLRKILESLQSENRIRGFKTLDAKQDISSLTDTVQEDDLILVVLTHQLDSQRKQIEEQLKTLKVAKPGVRLGEIIIDNVPYENKFITFPADLRPIKDREDQHAVWNDIEQNLKNIYPVKEPQQESSHWLEGVLEWPWESPGRWHGALFLGVPAFVVITIGLYLSIPIEFEREPFNMLLFSFFAGAVHGVAGAISRMRKAPLFFAVALAVGVMVLFVLFWGIDIDDYYAVALVFIGPVSAVVGAWAGLSDDPVRLTGMILLGLWPWLFAETASYDSAFLLNVLVIAVVLCLLAWRKPIQPRRAVKMGILPFALNLAGGYLIYMMVSNRGLEGSASGFTILTVIAALSLGLVYWLNKKKYSGNT